MARTKHTPAVLPHVRPFRRAALESGFAYGTLRDAHFRGELAIIKVGRRWYIEVEELARFVERNTERMAG
jgi:hypothetical protein